MKIQSMDLMLFFVLSLLNLLSISSVAQNANLESNKPFAQAYFGVKAPGDKAQLFEPECLNSYLKTVPANVLPFHSSIVFSPDGKEAYWGPMTGNGGILFSKFENGKWSEPKYLDVGLQYGGLDPVLSPDGNRLYFLSRQHPTKETRSKERIWYIERTEHGWSKAKPIDEIVNKYPTHWTFSVAENGNIYFNSDGVIYGAKFDGNQYNVPQKLSKAINNEMDNSCPFIAPDESYIIFTRGLKNSDDLFISFKDKKGEWIKAINLGENINTEDAHEMTPRVTPDGKYFFFLSKTTKAGMHWVNTAFIENLKPNK